MPELEIKTEIGIGCIRSKSLPFSDNLMEHINVNELKDYLNVLDEKHRIVIHFYVESLFYSAKDKALGGRGIQL